MTLLLRFPHLRSTKGMTLVESVVAIALASIVTTAIVGMVVLAVSAAASAKSRTTATRYAEEGMEVARSSRDKTDWTTFWTNVGTTVWQVDSSYSLTSAAGTPLSPYTREIRITNASNPTTSNDRAQVDVKVTWNDRGRTEVVELVSFLTKWAK